MTTTPGVRTQYLAFAQQLSSEFDEIRKQTGQGIGVVEDALREFLMFARDM